MRASYDRFKRVDAEFDAVLDLPTDDQAAYIERISAGDPTLRADLLQLLKAHRHSGGILDTPPSPVGALLGGEGYTIDAASPERIGPFRVVRAIGEGGMGQVFLGTRDDGQFEQRVALKIIRHPIPGLVRRFLEERRILARLEHPRIARLIDGGITDGQVPYFAMEFIDGEPIDRFCESRNLSLDARLALFEQVCEAVSYAHQHLVIHRDLKPGNILVTADGQVKLLDFGIAKLLDAPSGAPALDVTRTGLRVMTPEVAAPEQVRGGPISTATDVYALGILLYRLVSGERPYELRDKSLAEIERIVCDEMPTAPSSKAPPARRKLIRGDCDLIVMTALRKQPDRRYQSADALAEDLRRLRSGHAIHARPDALGYRAGKFFSRHRAAVIVAGVGFAALVAGGARERVLRQRAELEARKAIEVQNFLENVFEVVDPSAWTESERGMVSARDLLDRGARRIDSTLSAQPDVQAELRTVLGRVYSNLGLYDKAAPLLERSLAQRTTLRGAGDTSVATNMDLLGAVLTQLDRHDDAERMLRSALATRRNKVGNDSATAETVTHLASLFEEKGQLAAAESLHNEALAINRTLFGDSSLRVAESVNNVALVRYRRGAYDEAEKLYRRALDIQMRRLGERHVATSATMHNLAQTLELRGNLDEAEKYYRRSLAAKRAVLGDVHPSVTIGLNNLGIFLATTRNRPDDGAVLTREALALDRKMFGNRHTYVAEGLRNLGTILRTKGDFVGSDSAIREAIDIDRELVGERHEKMAMLYGQLAYTRYQLGDSIEAVRLTRESLARYHESLGANHRNTHVLEGNLARLLVEVGRPAEAESLARVARAGFDSTSPGTRSLFIASDRTLGAAILGQGRLDEALPVLKRASEMARREYGATSWRTAQAQLSYGRALVAKGRRAEGDSLVRAADATLQAQRAAQPRLAAQARSAMSLLRRD